MEMDNIVNHCIIIDYWKAFMDRSARNEQSQLIDQLNNHSDTSHPDDWMAKFDKKLKLNR